MNGVTPNASMSSTSPLSSCASSPPFFLLDALERVLSVRFVDKVGITPASGKNRRVRKKRTTLTKPFKMDYYYYYYSIWEEGGKPQAFTCEVEDETGEDGGPEWDDVARERDQPGNADGDDQDAIHDLSKTSGECSRINRFEYYLPDTYDLI
jgi:hypothetical protein